MYICKFTLGVPVKSKLSEEGLINVLYFELRKNGTLCLHVVDII